MRSVAELKAEATSLGVPEAQIGNYVVVRQKVDRDERAAQRELEREKLAAEERNRAREHELKRSPLRAQTPAATAPNIDGASLPKLPMLYDGDDVNSFFVRFERLAEDLNFDHNSYDVRLGTLLTGKSVNVYAALPVETIKDYNLLKAALMHGFNKTPENYRLEFRSLKISGGEASLT